MIKKYFYLSLLSFFITKNIVVDNLLNSTICARENIDSENTTKELKLIKSAFIELFLKVKNKESYLYNKFYFYFKPLRILIEYANLNKLKKTNFNIEDNKVDALKFLKSLCAVYTDPRNPEL